MEGLSSYERAKHIWRSALIRNPASSDELDDELDWPLDLLSDDLTAQSRMLEQRQYDEREEETKIKGELQVSSPEPSEAHVLYV